MIEVTDQAHLERLPDGTIIRWLRIPGDETSEAVAFVRVELEQRTDIDGRPMAFGNEAPGEMPGMMRTVWISPGGWQPMSIEEAGITYPVHVVRLGDDHPVAAHDCCLGTEHVEELSSPPEVFTIDSGGTWAREKALECAVRYWGNSSRTASCVTETAEAFEAWLTREQEPALPDVVPVTTHPVAVREAGEQRQLDVATRLVEAHAAILEARDEFGGSFCTDAALRRMIETAAAVYHRLGVKPDAPG